MNRAYPEAEIKSSPIKIKLEKSTTDLRKGSYELVALAEYKGEYPEVKDEGKSVSFKATVRTPIANISKDDGFETDLSLSKKVTEEAKKLSKKLK